jgi:hypothetical protein
VVWQRQRRRDPRGRSAAPVLNEPSPASASPLADPAFVAGLRPIPASPDAGPAAWPALDLEGTDPGGDAVTVRLGELGDRVLLAFLDTTCGGCAAFWSSIRRLDGGRVASGVPVAVVTRGTAHVGMEEVRQAMGDDAPRRSPVRVVMSDAAWRDYRVQGPPFFVLVETSTRTVVAETVAFGWSDVVALADRH